MTDALAIRNLTVAYRSGGRDRTVLRDVSFHIGRGEAYGLVGESGCGKSTVALTAVRYLPRSGRVTGGSDSSSCGWLDERTPHLRPRCPFHCPGYPPQGRFDEPVLRVRQGAYFRGLRGSLAGGCVSTASA